MKTKIDIAILIGVGVWAVLEFIYKTEFGPLNALILFGIIFRFALLPALEAPNKEEPKCPER
jgi:hypothetical protein